MVKHERRKREELVRAQWESSRVIAWIIAKQGFKNFNTPVERFLPLPWDAVAKQARRPDRAQELAALKKILGEHGLEEYMNSKYWPYKKEKSCQK